MSEGVVLWKMDGGVERKVKRRWKLKRVSIEFCKSAGAAFVRSYRLKRRLCEDTVM